MSEHTPGPYESDGWSVYKLVANPFQRKGGPDTLNLWLANVQPCGIAVESSELEAVATLFKAAPDLLEALESNEWSYSDDLRLDYGFCQTCKRLRHQGHADNCIVGLAFKKARGES